MEEVKDNLPTYSVSELSGAVKTHIESHFGRVRVRGELGRVARPASGHVYFDVKDDKAVLAAVAWKGVAQSFTVPPEQGLEVIITGRLTTFEGQSRYQIIVETLEPAGVGALMALLEARRKKLTSEGLFEAAHKKPLPFLPQVIGVITSPSGAVIRDILHRLSDRFPRSVLVWAVKVQGEGCAEEVAHAINGFNALDSAGKVPRPDLLIVARGGGSLEDLWGFNEEVVVRAAAASAIPLISAIGHETDTTLLDYAADYRAPTPTAAAEKAVPVRAELLANLADLQSRKLRALERLTRDARRALATMARLFARADNVLEKPRQQLDVLDTRLQHGLRGAVVRARTDYNKLATRLSLKFLRALWRVKQAALHTAARGLSLLSHEAVLQRGFALVMNSAGQLVRHPKDAPANSQIKVRLAGDASFAARVGTTGKTTSKSKSKNPAKSSDDPQKKLL